MIFLWKARKEKDGMVGFVLNVTTEGLRGKRRR